MAHYRLYLQNGEGRFAGARDVEVADDAAALEVARQLKHTYGVEVWSGTRKVGLVEPEWGKTIPRRKLGAKFG